MRVGIVAVHGVIPHPRYGFQDEVAEQLATALNRKDGADCQAWQTAVVFPDARPESIPSSDPTSVPTITRVHRDERDPQNPVGTFYDVHEAYWSPLDKNRTTAARVLCWLLNTLFVPENTTARYEERPDKVAWDICFGLVAGIVVASCFCVAVIGAAWAIDKITGAKGIAVGLPMAWRLLGDPMGAFHQLTWSQVVRLIVGAIGAFFLGQTVRAARSISVNMAALKARAQADRDVPLRSRLVFLALLAVVAAGGICFCAFARVHGEHALLWAGPILAGAVLAFEAGRALASSFLVGFFGDVQIYCTRDENSAFFALREQILALVAKTIEYVIGTEPLRTPYDRVYVFAHSLGSTIAMDALMRLYNAQKAGTLGHDSWPRIRAFITFGTSLEKTNYFFRAASPTQSVEYEEWQDALYGPIFTDDDAVLRNPSASAIYWLNCWYFSDLVCDAICSYKTYASAGDSPAEALRARRGALAATNAGKKTERVVAHNRGRFGNFAPWRLHFFTHGDYLQDQLWFWAGEGGDGREIGIIDVVTSVQCDGER